MKLPEGKWNIYVDGEKAGTEILGSAETEVSVAPISAMVLVKDVPQTTVDETAGENSAGILLGAAAAVAAVAAAACVMVKRRKKES